MRDERSRQRANDDEAIAADLARALVAYLRRVREASQAERLEAPVPKPAKPEAERPKGHPVLREADAAKYIGFSRSFLRKGRLEGRGPAYLRLGRQIRYRIADLDQWLSTHRHGSER